MVLVLFSAASSFVLPSTPMASHATTHVGCARGSPSHLRMGFFDMFKESEEQKAPRFLCPAVLRSQPCR